MRWGFLLLILGLALPALAGERPPVKLGLVVPAAGDAGRVGQSMRQAAELALADHAGALHRKVELLVREEPFDPRQAVGVAERLVQEGVWGVVGHFYSSTSIPAAAVYAGAGIPQITPTATHPRLTAQGWPTVFRVSGRDDQQAETAVEFILSRLRGRRIVIIHDRTEYGRNLAEGCLRALQRRGRRAAAVEEIAQGDKAFGELVGRLAVHPPDVLYFAGIFREAGYLLKQMRQAGLRATFVSGDAVLDPEFVKIAGEAAASGAYLTFSPDPRRLSSAQDVIRRFEAQYGPIGPYVLHTYDAVGVLLQGIQVADPRSNTSGELRKVAQAIHGMVYRGALGRLQWDRRGDLTRSPYVVYVARKGGSLDGWFEQVARGPAATLVAASPSATR
jgi:branched-chain amino acid transport system substrate-binding protein